jgi:hypothetical protein
MVEKEQAVDVHLAVVAAATAAVSFVPAVVGIVVVMISETV